MTIDHDGRIPVYLQLAAILREGIERGDYPPGRRLPSENHLQQEYGLARGTVRKAARVLADEGLVEVVAGRGVYSFRPSAGSGGAVLMRGLSLLMAIKDRVPGILRSTRARARSGVTSGVTGMPTTTQKLLDTSR